MTPDEQTAIAIQVGRIEAKIEERDRKLDAIHGSLKEDLKRIEGETARSLERIEKQTTATNGRVSALEKGEAAVKGAIAALSLPIVIFGFTQLFG